MTEKWFYIPVEIKVRELQAKILLAAMAVRHGYRVVIGRKAELLALMPFLPPGNFLGIWTQDNFLDLYETLGKRGFSVAIMDEEGLVTFHDDTYLRRKLSAKVLSSAKLFLAWGRHQENVVKKIEAEKLPVFAETGNVRFDILRPEFRALLEPEISAIRAKYGRIILINSSFAKCNYYHGKEKYFSDLKKKNISKNPEDEKLSNAYFDLKLKVFESFLAAIPELARRFPSHTIIIRPHPSENFAAWEDVGKGFDNIKVIHEGSIHPWLLASELVVHHFCTTALESFAGGVPSIAYRPFRDDTLETRLAYLASLETHTQEELLTAAEKILSGDLSDLEKKREENLPVLKTYIANLDGAFAYERTLDALRPFDVLGTTLAETTILKRRARALAVTIFRALKGMCKRKASYVDHKFPYLKAQEIRTALKIIGQVMPGGPEINIRKIDGFCFMLSKKDD